MPAVVSPFRHATVKPVEGRVAFDDPPPKKGQGRVKPAEPADEGWRDPLVPGMTCDADGTVTCQPVHVYQIPHVVGAEVVWLPWRVESPTSKVVLEDGSVAVEDAKGIRHIIPAVHVLTVYPS